MFEPVFKLRTFGRSPALNETILCALLEALTRINVAAMRAYRVPPIYGAGLVYQREPLCRYCEEWRDCLSVIEHGGGDCEDLACYRAAELQLQGIAARPYVRRPRLLPGGVLLYHIQVAWPDGRIEDPSKKLGMGKVIPHVFGPSVRTPRVGRGIRLGGYA
ncbi:MAG TPA: hypothetical protein VHC69_26225 [Polyangiaceae bacterium]|nr:hypothetical protein [Polyangiaceae bacterium]